MERQREKGRALWLPGVLNLTGCSFVPSDRFGCLVFFSYVNSIEKNERLGPKSPRYRVHWGENQKIFIAGGFEKGLVEHARGLGLAKVDPGHGYFIILLGDLR